MYCMSGCVAARAIRAVWSLPALFANSLPPHGESLPPTRSGVLAAHCAEYEFSDDGRRASNHARPSPREKTTRTEKRDTG